MIAKEVVRLFKSIGAQIDPRTGIVSDKRVARITPSSHSLPKQIVEHLNAARKGSLLKALANALRAAIETPSSWPSGDKFTVMLEKHPRRQELQRLRKELDGRISSHAQHPIADKVRDLNKKLARRPVTVTTFFTTNKPVRLFLGPQSKTHETRIVFEIINASNAGALKRLKMCDHCQRFFIARRDADRFCPGNSCRKAWYRRTPKGRKRNREHQRMWRLNHGPLAAHRGTLQP
jgi:hypothetical protein